MAARIPDRQRSLPEQPRSGPSALTRSVQGSHHESSVLPKLTHLQMSAAYLSTSHDSRAPPRYAQRAQHEGVFRVGGGGLVDMGFRHALLWACVWACAGVCGAVSC